mgnify:CR=1 FL=1
MFLLFDQVNFGNLISILTQGYLRAKFRYYFILALGEVSSIQTLVISWNIISGATAARPWTQG